MIVVPTEMASTFLDDLIEFYEGRISLDDAMWIFEERYMRVID